ncbi:MAG: sporulation initiation factor Spo0A C-terminal domain-containing protein [Eubacteriales bacterium]|nr:sporulation initiation factor Spo0A C-terminal domain-containing protein [Eubacteriales bacterium]
MDQLNEKLTNISKEEEKNLDRKVVDILLSLGISPNLQGYTFLKESIKLAIYNPSYIGAITKIMYPTIAIKFKTTACRVERSIRHAIEVSYMKGKIYNINEIFGLKILEENEKPTNSEFVALIADRLALEINY